VAHAFSLGVTRWPDALRLVLFQKGAVVDTLVRPPPNMPNFPLSNLDNCGIFWEFWALRQEFGHFEENLPLVCVCFRRYFRRFSAYLRACFGIFRGMIRRMLWNSELEL
jgi:hypothetical protein